MGELWQASKTHTHTRWHIRGGTEGSSSTSKRQRQPHGCSTLLQIIHCCLYHISPAVNTQIRLQAMIYPLKKWFICVFLSWHLHFPLSNRLSHQFIDLSAAVPGKYHIESLPIWHNTRRLNDLTMEVTVSVCDATVLSRAANLWPPHAGRPSPAWWWGSASASPPAWRCYSCSGISGPSCRPAAAGAPAGHRAAHTAPLRDREEKHILGLSTIDCSF